MERTLLGDRVRNVDPRYIMFGIGFRGLGSAGGFRTDPRVSESGSNAARWGVFFAMLSFLELRLWSFGLR